ncbi:MAG TPA: DUF433 domain-containing protein [Anaerolineales bacterium]|nr:DUF433 domain-containing protein [Anaerolineales bacterium]
MSTAIRAIYRNGVFEPLDEAEGLTDNQVIELEIHPLPPVTSNPRIMGGRPCITGTRMPIDWVMGYLEAGRTLEQFLSDYPQYNREQVVVAIRYAVESMGYTEVSLE